MNNLNNRPLLKTVGGVLLFGDGDIPIQTPLESGVNIKTVNGASLLGAGNIVIGGALKYIATVTAAGYTQVDVDQGISAAYDNYLIIGRMTAGSAALPWVRAQLKIGGAWIAAGYYGNCSALNSGSAVWAGLNANNASASAPVGLVNNVAGETSDFYLQIGGANDAGRKNAKYEAQLFGPNLGSSYTLKGGFSCTTAGILSGVRFQADVGTITGAFDLFAIARE